MKSPLKSQDRNSDASDHLRAYGRLCSYCWRGLSTVPVGSLGGLTLITFFLKDTFSLAIIVLIPSTAMAIYIQQRLQNKTIFHFEDLVFWAMTGWGIAVFLGPLSLSISLVYSGDISWIELPKWFFAVLFLGTIFGVIPFFAFCIGLPCTVVALLLAYLCTKSVDQPQNTSLPKRTKPV